jgi:CBS domain-containing membrane protein
MGLVASAAVGVTFAKFIADPMLAAALAVGMAIAVMHYLRATHPQGGATALTAVIGGPQFVTNSDAGLSLRRCLSTRC